MRADQESWTLLHGLFVGEDELHQDDVAAIIERDMIIRRIGTLPAAELAHVESRRRISLALPGT